MIRSHIEVKMANVSFKNINFEQMPVFLIVEIFIQLYYKHFMEMIIK